MSIFTCFTKEYKMSGGYSNEINEPDDPIAEPEDYDDSPLDEDEDDEDDDEEDDFGDDDDEDDSDVD